MSDRLVELEARVQRLEDREAIHGLFMRYRQCLDEKDFGGYAELFAEDGEFVGTPGRGRQLKRAPRGARREAVTA